MADEQVGVSGVVESQEQAPERVVESPGVPAEEGQEAPVQATESGASIRDLAKQYGLDLTSAKSDEDALRHLATVYQQAQQIQQYVPYAQRYLQYSQQFEQWLQQQQQQTQQPKQSSWWNPPEFNPSWRNLLTRDPETGELKLAPGAPPDVLPKYLAYEQYRKDFAERLTSDPENTLRPLIEGVSAQVAKHLIDQYFTGYTDQTYAQQFVSQHSSWLHQRDVNGNVIRDPVSGQPVLTAEGRKFRDYVIDAERSGIRDVRKQEEYARKMLALDLLYAQYGQQSAGQKSEQIKQNFIAANRQPNHSTSGPPVETGAAISLADRLRQAFAQEGVTEHELANSI